MLNTRSWQDSFDRLETSRREERRREAEERQIRAADAAYARASLEVANATVTSKAEATGFMLEPLQADQAEMLVKPKQPSKSAIAKSPSAKAKPRKRAAPRRTARVEKPRTARPKVTGPKVTGSKAAGSKAAGPKVPKPIAAKSLVSPPRNAPAQVTPPPAVGLPRKLPSTAAEPLLITPLPHHASLAPYRKPGLFGLIGSWLRLAARSPGLPGKLGKPARQPCPPRNDMAALRAENRQLRRELEALLALQANTPPWSTTPAGDAPARPRPRGGTRA